MIHQSSSIKSSRAWPNKTKFIELSSIFCAVTLICVLMVTVITNAKITIINCQLASQPCPNHIQDQLQVIHNRSFFLSSPTNELQNSDLGSQYMIQSLQVDLFNTVNVSLIPRSPLILFVENDQPTQALYEDGQLQNWVSSDIPIQTPLLFLTSQNIQLSTQGIVANNNQFLKKVLTFIQALQATNLEYQKLELLSSDTVKIWLNSQDWVLTDISNPDSIQNLVTILNHPDFNTHQTSDLQLDLRFQYPLLLKTN